MTDTPLREALERLVDKITSILDDPKYQAVWTLNHIRSGPYTGPQYAEELEEAREVLRTSYSLWRPIESAPKDGSYIIGARFGSDGELHWIADLHWLTTGEVAELEGIGEPDEETECGFHDARDDLRNPTHWQPITPPSEVEETR